MVYKLSDENIIKYTKYGYSIKEIAKIFNYKNLDLIRKKVKNLNLKENYKCTQCGTSHNLKKQYNRNKEFVTTNICIDCSKELGITLTNKRIKDKPYKDRSIFYKEYIIKDKSLWELCDLWKAKSNTIKKYLDLYGFEEKYKCLTCNSSKNLILSTGKDQKLKYQKYCKNCHSKIFSNARKNFYKEKHDKINKDILIDLHINKKLNLYQIVDILHISKKTCLSFFKKYNIKEVKRCNFCGEEDLNLLVRKNSNPLNICVSCSESSGTAPFSKISQEFFWSLCNKLPKDIKHSVCFKEFNREKAIIVDDLSRNFLKIKNKTYYLDFYVDCLGIPVAIEFNGDVFHGNPDKYKYYDKPNPFTNDTALELWDRDEARLDFLTVLDYYVMFVWEGDYLKNKKYWVDVCLYQIMTLYKNKKKEYTLNVNK